MENGGFGLGQRHGKFVQIRKMAEFIRTDKVGDIDVVEGTRECSHCFSQ